MVPVDMKRPREILPVSNKTSHPCLHQDITFYDFWCRGGDWVFKGEIRRKYPYRSLMG